MELQKNSLKIFGMPHHKKQNAIKKVWVRKGLMFCGWGDCSQRDVKLRFNGKSIKLFVMTFNLDEEHKGHE